MGNLLKKRGGMVFVATAAALTVLPFLDASAQVTLPTTGVDVEDYITALVTLLGGIAGAAIAGWAAFFAIRTHALASNFTGLNCGANCSYCDTGMWVSSMNHSP